MKIKVWHEIKEISSLDEEIVFVTPEPEEYRKEKEERRKRYPPEKGFCIDMCEPLITWGFRGTVREALEKHPEVITLIE